MRGIRIISIIVSIILFSAASLYPEYEVNPSLETKISQAVVKVIVLDKSNRKMGTGTGFFITLTRVITNRHVIQRGHHAKIKSIGGEVFDVQGVVAYDETLDLVLLETRVPFRKFKPLQVSNLLPFKGDRVIVIGNPWGRGPRTTTGIVTDIQNWPLIDNVLEYSAPTFPGNSGSPVLNERGRVLGVATWGKNMDGQRRGYGIPCREMASMDWGKVMPLDEFNQKLKNIWLAREMMNKGLTFYKYNDYRKALPYFQKAVEMKSEFPEAWMLLGVCKYKTGLFEDAVESYLKATQLRHDFAEAYYWLGRAYEGMSENQKAVDSYISAIIYRDRYVAAHYRLGNLYLEIGKIKLARKKYIELIELDVMKARTLRLYIDKAAKAK